MDELKLFIKNYDVSNSAAAAILGVCAASVSEWVNGRKDVPDYIIKSCAAHNSLNNTQRKKIKAMVVKK